MKKLGRMTICLLAIAAISGCDDDRVACEGRDWTKTPDWCNMTLDEKLAFIKGGYYCTWSCKPIPQCTPCEQQCSTIPAPGAVILAGLGVGAVKLLRRKRLLGG